MNKNLQLLLILLIISFTSCSSDGDSAAASDKVIFTYMSSRVNDTTSLTYIFLSDKTGATTGVKRVLQNESIAFFAKELRDTSSFNVNLFKKSEEQVHINTYLDVPVDRWEIPTGTPEPLPEGFIYYTLQSDEKIELRSLQRACWNSSLDDSGKKLTGWCALLPGQESLYFQYGHEGDDRRYYKMLEGVKSGDSLELNDDDFQPMLQDKITLKDPGKINLSASISGFIDSIELFTETLKDGTGNPDELNITYPQNTFEKFGFNYFSSDGGGGSSRVMLGKQEQLPQFDFPDFDLTLNNTSSIDAFSISGSELVDYSVVNWITENSGFASNEVLRWSFNGPGVISDLSIPELPELIKGELKGFRRTEDLRFQSLEFNKGEKGYEEIFLSTPSSKDHIFYKEKFL